MIFTGRCALFRYYFLDLTPNQGVVTTESRLTNPLDGVTGDPDHGYGTGRAGTFSVINNGWKTIMAGNYVAWQFPAAPFHPGGDVYKFNDGNTTNFLARYGVPTTQFRPEYVPFDHLDFKVQLAAAFAALNVTKDQGGVSDMGFLASLPNTNSRRHNSPHTGIQDETNGYKFGFSGIGLTLIETLLRRGILAPGPAYAAAEASEAYDFAAEEPRLSAENAHDTAAEISRIMGLWNQSDSGQGLLREFMADLLLKSISPEDPHRSQALDRFQQATLGRTYFDIATREPSTHKDLYGRLRTVAAEFTCQGVTGSWYSKTSKIVGKAMNDAAPADTTHVLFGHFRH